MSDPGPVEANIRHALQKNGFPEKTVKLPFKPVYRSCREYGTALAEVLAHLKADGVISAFEGDFIVFRSPENAARAREAAAETASGTPPLNAGWMAAMAKMAGFDNLSEDDMKQAFESLTPEQREDIQKRVAGMSPEDKQNLLQSLSRMFNPNRT